MQLISEGVTRTTVSLREGERLGIIRVPSVAPDQVSDSDSQSRAARRPGHPGLLPPNPSESIEE